MRYILIFTLYGLHLGVFIFTLVGWCIETHIKTNPKKAQKMMYYFFGNIALFVYGYLASFIH